MFKTNFEVQKKTLICCCIDFVITTKQLTDQLSSVVIFPNHQYREEKHMKTKGNRFLYSFKIKLLKLSITGAQWLYNAGGRDRV